VDISNKKKRKKEKEVVDNRPALGEVSVFADTHRQLSVLLEKEKKNIGQDVSWTWIHVSGINLDSGSLQNCLR